MADKQKETATSKPNTTTTTSNAATPTPKKKSNRRREQRKKRLLVKLAVLASSSPDVVLSDEQKKALEAIKNKEKPKTENKDAKATPTKKRKRESEEKKEVQNADKTKKEEPKKKKKKKAESEPAKKDDGTAEAKKKTKKRKIEEATEGKEEESKEKKTKKKKEKESTEKTGKSDAHKEQEEREARKKLDEKQKLRRRTISVSNFPYKVTSETLKKFFEERAGNVESVDMKKFKSGLSKGTAKVIFTNAEAVKKALLLDRTELEGRKLFVDKPGKKKKKTDVPIAERDMTNKTQTRTIHVAGFGDDVTKEDLEQFFAPSRAGPIKEIRTTTKTLGGKKHNIAFVQFYYWDYVESAIKLHGTRLKGRPVKIKYAVEK